MQRKYLIISLSAAALILLLRCCIITWHGAGPAVPPPSKPAVIKKEWQSGNRPLEIEKQRLTDAEKKTAAKLPALKATLNKARGAARVALVIVQQKTDSLLPADTATRAAMTELAIQTQLKDSIGNEYIGVQDSLLAVRDSLLLTTEKQVALCTEQYSKLFADYSRLYDQQKHYKRLLRRQKRKTRLLSGTGLIVGALLFHSLSK